MENDLGVFRGVVFEYDVRKGFGFINITHINSGNGFSRLVMKMDQVFAHHRSIEPNKEGFKKLMQDQVVELTVIKRDKGLAAKDVKILGDGSDMEEFKGFTRYAIDNKKESNNQNKDNYYNKEEFNK